MPRRPLPPDPARIANSKSDDVFIKEYLPSDWAQHPLSTSSPSFRLIFYGARNLPDSYLEACYSLVETTSKDDYVNGSFGWRPATKRTEMRSPALRYFLLVDADDALRGFMSVMPTWEGNEPVVYCYELHLDEDLRGSGLGKYLMNLALDVARRIDGIEKVMLTCFVSNERALSFYKNMDFVEDETSPAPRELRGKVIMPDYVILGRYVSLPKENMQDEKEAKEE